MTAAEAQSNLNRRVLVSEFGGVKEAMIIEISPSAEYVKLRWPSGHEFWCRMDEYAFVESLPSAIEVAAKSYSLEDIEKSFQKWQYGPDSAIGSERWRKDGKQGI